MGGSEPPYLYDQPGRRPISYPYSDFDPKAVTRASWERASLASKPRPKQEGPLLDFNKHPDSYVVVRGSQTEYETLPQNIKKKIIWTRWAQLALRVSQLLITLGLLAAVICFKKVQSVQSYIIRVPPAWDSLISLYAVYHLARTAKARTPASSASYHMFALIMDICLLPFYVFTALFAWQNYQLPIGDANRWTSFFEPEDGTPTLMMATFIISCVLGGLHLISTGPDLYLSIMFRKIARLPPDMNPLEDNLTSRRGNKHKYKNSEMSLASNDTFAEKKSGYLSGSTLNLNDDEIARKLPFAHSRNDSSVSFNPHNPESARLSRQQFEGGNMYQQSQYARSSRQTFVDAHSRAGSVSPSKRGSYISVGDAPLPPPKSPERERRNSANRPGSSYSPNGAPSHAGAQAEQKTSLLNDNWYVLDAEDDDMGSPSRQRPQNKENDFVPQPLRMNPPSPTMEQQNQKRSSYPNPAENYYAYANHSRNNSHASNSAPLAEISVNRTPTSATDKTAGSSVYSESAPALKTAPKSRYYGDLNAATQAVRGGGAAGYAQLPQIPQSPSASPGPPQGINGTGYDFHLPRRDGKSPEPVQQAQYAKRNSQYNAQQAFMPSTVDRYVPSPIDRYGSISPAGERVVSRSGADIADESVLFLPSEGQDRRSVSGKSRRRMVSGKVAEEGMGGRWR